MLKIFGWSCKWRARFTYHHNAFTEYWAMLDRWYMLYALKFDGISPQILIDHSLGLSDHAPLWMNLQFGMHVDELPLHTCRLTHVNQAYL